MAAYRDTVAEVQTQFLEQLGIFQKGYAPEHAVGGRRVVFDSLELKDRLSLAGFDGSTLRRYFLGDVSMTLRVAFLIAGAARGGAGNRSPIVSLKLEAL